MQITHLGHAAVLVETDSARILIDPGNFSSKWHGLSDLDAIVITHQHADHADAEHLPALLDANPEATALAEPQAAKQLGMPRIKPFEAGQKLEVGAITINAIGGTHAEIHRDIPRVGNIGVILTAEGEPTFFHPGDSLAETPDGIDVVAIPAYGPWAAMKETVDFARAVGAPQGFLIHEGLLAERGFALVFHRISDMSETTMIDLRDATPHTFTR